MCGRFSVTYDAQELEGYFHATFDEAKEWTPNYNAAPGQLLPVLKKSNKLELFKWGIETEWSKNKLINARSETIDEKPTFRSLFNKKRCLIVSDGFYEWHREAKGQGKPYRFELEKRRPFAFAGIYDTGFAIITRKANQIVDKVHDRMPVILDPDNYEAYLNPDTPSDFIKAMLDPHANNELKAYPVSPLVNSPSHNSPAVLKPV